MLTKGNMQVEKRRTSWQGNAYHIKQKGTSQHGEWNIMAGEMSSVATHLDWTGLTVILFALFWRTCAFGAQLVISWATNDLRLFTANFGTPPRFRHCWYIFLLHNSLRDVLPDFPHKSSFSRCSDAFFKIVTQQQEQQQQKDRSSRFCFNILIRVSNPSHTFAVQPMQPMCRKLAHMYDPFVSSIIHVMYHHSALL